MTKANKEIFSSNVYAQLYGNLEVNCYGGLTSKDAFKGVSSTAPLEAHHREYFANGFLYRLYANGQCKRYELVQENCDSALVFIDQGYKDGEDYVITHMHKYYEYGEYDKNSTLRIRGIKNYKGHYEGPYIKYDEKGAIREKGVKDGRGNWVGLYEIFNEDGTPVVDTSHCANPGDIRKPYQGGISSAYRPL